MTQIERSEIPLIRSLRETERREEPDAPGRPCGSAARCILGDAEAGSKHNSVQYDLHVLHAIAPGDAQHVCAAGQCAALDHHALTAISDHGDHRAPLRIE